MTDDRPGIFTTPAPYVDDFLTAAKTGWQVIQYYRRSGVALTLDGDNNTAVFKVTEGSSDAHILLGTGFGLQVGLNLSYASAMPLINGNASTWSLTQLDIFALLLVVFYLFNLF